MAANEDSLRKALEDRLGPCPMCQGSDWQTRPEAVAVIPMHDQEAGGLKLARGGDSDADAFGFAGIEALVVACMDCGFLALFHMKTLLGDNDAAG